MKIKKFIKKHIKAVIAAVVIVGVVAAFMLKGSGQAVNMAEEAPALRDIYTYKSFVGNVEPSTDTSVISKVSQQVTQLLVEEGDTVKKGDVIAVIDSSSVEQNIAKTELSLSSSQTSNSHNISDAERNYDNYKEALDGGLNSSLNSAQNTLDSAYNSLQQAKEDYDTTVWRVDNGVYAGTQAKYDAKASAQGTYDAAAGKVANLQAAYDAAKKTYEDAQNASENPANSLESLKQAFLDAESALNAGNAELESARIVLEQAQSDFAWARQEVVETKQAAIDSAQASYNTALKNYEVTQLSVNQQLESYEATLDKTKATSSTASTELELQNLKDSLEDYTIYAPCDGTITELNIAEGSMVSNGVSIATISNLSAMKVAINVDEYSILDTGAGSSVTIIIDSIGKTYEGTITRVSDTASLNNGVSYFEATVDFTADEYVKSGMSVEVRLTSTDKKGVLTVSADALHYYDDNTAYVLVKNGDTQEMRDVELGATDGNYVEILSGLEIEEIVLVTPSAGSVFPEPGPGMGGE